MQTPGDAMTRFPAIPLSAADILPGDVAQLMAGLFVQSRQPVESIMRYRYEPGIRASQLLQKLETLPEPWHVVPKDQPLLIEPMPRNLVIALLTLWHTDHGEQVIQALYAKGHARANRNDYAELVPLGNAVRDHHGYHAITPIGRFRARLLAQSLAAELGLRLVSYRPIRSGWRRANAMSDAGNA